MKPWGAGLVDECWELTHKCPSCLVLTGMAQRQAFHTGSRFPWQDEAPSNRREADSRRQDPWCFPPCLIPHSPASRLGTSQAAPGIPVLASRLAARCIQTKGPLCCAPQASHRLPTQGFLQSSSRQTCRDPCNRAPLAGPEPQDQHSAACGSPTTYVPSAVWAPLKWPISRAKMIRVNGVPPLPTGECVQSFPRHVLPRDH